MNSRIMWVAALRALYLQALHPRVVRGTQQRLFSGAMRAIHRAESAGDILR